MVTLFTDSVNICESEFGVEVVDGLLYPAVSNVVIVADVSRSSISKVERIPKVGTRQI